MEPYGSLLLTGGRRCTKCQITHAKEVESMKLTRCAEHMSFTYAPGLRPALYKGLHVTSGRLVQKVVAGKGGCPTDSSYPAPPSSDIIATATNPSQIGLVNRDPGLIEMGL